MCQPSGQPPAVEYVWSKQGLFNCYLTMIYNILSRCARKKRRRCGSRVRIGYSIVVSRWANTLAVVVSLVQIARGVSSLPLFYTSITSHTHKYIFIIVWLYTSNMINCIVYLSRSEIRQNIKYNHQHLSPTNYMEAYRFEKIINC